MRFCSEMPTHIHAEQSHNTGVVSGGLRSALCIGHPVLPSETSDAGSGFAYTLRFSKLAARLVVRSDDLFNGAQGRGSSGKGGSSGSGKETEGTIAMDNDELLQVTETILEGERPPRSSHAHLDIRSTPPGRGCLWGWRLWGGWRGGCRQSRVAAEIAAAA